MLPEDFKEEIGGIVGLFVSVVYTIIYILIFVVFDNNWIDIFKSFNLRW